MTATHQASRSSQELSESLEPPGPSPRPSLPASRSNEELNESLEPPGRSPCPSLPFKAHRSDWTTISQKSRDFRRAHFPGADDEVWNDWRWQLANRFTDPDRLSQVITLSEDEQLALYAAGGPLPFSVTPYFLSLVEADDPQGPIRRTIIPTTAERLVSQGESADPLEEDHDSPVPGLVHRYPDRVLLLATSFCSTYCRYCTRSRLVGRDARPRLDRKALARALAYIESNKNIRDVLVSGGDPLAIADRELDQLLSRLRSIRHLEIIRIGTKVPVVLPQRITHSLTEMLRQYHPLFVSIHFAHPHELTPETAEACSRLADAGIPLGSQTVLLRGVNDDIRTMTRLTQGLLKIRVRPYYLYQCDPILGSAHFRTPVAKGLDIIQGLRGHTSGYAVPTYVIDSPGGGGKIALMPECVVGREDGQIMLRNYEGRTFVYPDLIAGPVN